MELTGLHSRVVQHESDHLDGVMFTDRVTDTVLNNLTPLLDDFVGQMAYQQETGVLPPEEELIAELKRLESERTG